MKKRKLSPSQQLERLCQEELPKLADVMYVPHEKGYLIFEKYFLYSSKGEWVVAVNNTTKTFFSSAVAIAWIISYNKSNIDMSRNIEIQAKRYSHYSAETAYLTSILNNVKNDPDAKDILRAKLSHTQFQVTQAQFELSKCLKIAKYWQTIGFNNETTRPSTQRSSCFNK